MSKNYYDILGVNKNASDEEIKKAFRKAAHKHHPDKDGGDEAKFKEVNEAYQVLGNKQKRGQYDQFGTTFDSAGMGGGRGGFNGAGGFNWQDFARSAGSQGRTYQGNVNFDDFAFDLGDIFGDIFGFGGNRRQSNRRSTAGEDIQIAMDITFDEAIFGAQKVISLDVQQTCNHCHGQGAEPGTKIETCNQCGGSGRIQQTSSTIFGQFATQAVCPTCNGAGKKPEKFCSKCHGQTRVKNKKEIKIEIPAGINSGQTIKIPSQGNAGRENSIAGDLYITFNIKDSSRFKREGFDIISKLKISIPQAVLGDKIPVDTVHGQVNLKIPSGTDSGKIFVLKNKGVPVLNKAGAFGDHLVEVEIDIPKKLSRNQKKLFEELSQEL